jgi:putative FmdB family regulatory protein
MPTYEFRCPDGHIFERFYRKISDSVTETPCPECGKPATRQLSAGAGLLFKGSGFYLTDYGKNAHRGSGTGTRDAGGEKTAEGPATTPSDSKSAESKPAEPKTETASKDSKAADTKAGSSAASGTSGGKSEK